MTGGRKKKMPKSKGRRVEHGFVTYGGHIPELDMLISEDGYYFKMYLGGDREGGETDPGTVWKDMKSRYLCVRGLSSS